MSFKKYLKIKFTLSVGVSLLACSTPKVGGVSTQQCWQHQLGEQNFRNVVTICTTEKQANMIIYFPNPSDVPTTCTQPGTVIEKVSGSIVFKFESGSCLNGRTGMALTLVCKDAMKNSLTCSAPGTSLTGDYIFEPLNAPLK